ncbi:MAG TPA: TonB family protein [Pyrinomonadaceae bacterium]|jgi:TonB family protein
MQTEFTFNRGAVRPIQCLSGGWQLLRGVYGSFLGVVIVGILIMIAGGCIPLAPLNAPIMCGIYLCLLARIYNQPFNTSTLFKGFQYFAQSFIASLFVSVPMFILGLVFQFGMGGFQVVLSNLKIEKNTPPEQILPLVIAFFGYIFGGILVLMLVGMVLNALMLFVYPLIVERNMNGLDAVKLGFRAVLGNFFGVFILTILETLIILAGVMLFYVGALFVIPIIFAARIVAYRQVFTAPAQPPEQINAGAPQQMWTPQMITSKAGWYLTASAVLILGLAATGIAGLTIWSYNAISEAVKKAEEKRRETDYDYNSPPYYKPDTNSSDSNDATISGNNLNDKAVELPPPVYPPAAKAVRASGAVVVEITVNNKGEVTTANAISGHPLLRASAVAAARKAKFKPNAATKGVLTYNFAAQN